MKGSPLMKGGNFTSKTSSSKKNKEIKKHHFPKNLNNPMSFILYIKKTAITHTAAILP